MAALEARMESILSTSQANSHDPFIRFTPMKPTPAFFYPGPREQSVSVMIGARMY